MKKRTNNFLRKNISYFLYRFLLCIHLKSHNYVIIFFWIFVNPTQVLESRRHVLTQNKIIFIVAHKKMEYFISREKRNFVSWEFSWEIFFIPYVSRLFLGFHIRSHSTVLWNKKIKKYFLCKFDQSRVFKLINFKLTF